MTTVHAKTDASTPISRENWQLKKDRLKEKYPHLDDTDLNYEEGKVEELIDNIHSKIGKTIGKTKEGLHKLIEAL